MVDVQEIKRTIRCCIPYPPFPVAPDSNRLGPPDTTTNTRHYDGWSRSYWPTGPSAFRSSSISDGGEDHISALRSISDGGEDHISALPDDLRLNILSRLPLKDAARTSLLSNRWRDLWMSNSLIFQDNQLVEFAVRPLDESPLVQRISKFLESYRGPFGWLHLYFDYIQYEREVANWLRLFAEKGVNTLVLNHKCKFPYVLAMLPSSILTCSKLRRLYLGLWKFPDTTGLARRSDVFPYLEEVGICHTVMQDHDFDYLLACSPQLKTVNFIESYNSPSRLCISSHTLSRIVLWFSTVEEIVVVMATRLQRLILEPGRTAPAGTTNVRIGEVPQLAVLGYLQTASHELMIGNTIIKAGLMHVRPDATVPSVKVLALKVCFGVAEEVKTLLSFLRCFPHVETLHVKMMLSSQDNGEANVELSPVFWQNVGQLECIESHLTKVVLDQTTVVGNEFGFIKMLIGKAEMLQEMVLVLPSKMSSTKVREVTDRMTEQRALGKVARFELRMIQSLGSPWSYVSDVSSSDPFPPSAGQTVFWSPELGCRNLRWLRD